MGQCFALRNTLVVVYYEKKPRMQAGYTKKKWLRSTTCTYNIKVVRLISLVLKQSVRKIEPTVGSTPDHQKTQAQQNDERNMQQRHHQQANTTNTNTT